MEYEKDHVWYLWARDGQLIIGDDVEKVKKEYHLDRDPDMRMTEGDLDKCGRLVRVIDNKIFVGKTDEEKQEEKKRAEMFNARFKNPEKAKSL